MPPGAPKCVGSWVFLSVQLALAFCNPLSVWTVGVDSPDVAKAVGQAQQVGGHVFVPAGQHAAEGVLITGNVTISGAAGASLRGCNATLLTVAAGAHAVFSGLALESACPGGAEGAARTVGLSFSAGSSGRVEHCSLRTEVGLEVHASLAADVRHEFEPYI